MEALGATSSIIAIVELCVKVTEYISSARDARKDRSRLKAEILACQELLDALQEESDDAEDAQNWSTTIETLKGVGAPLAVLHETLSLLAAKLKPAHTLARTLTWPFQEKDVTKILNVIERQKSSLSLALENDTRLLVKEIESHGKETLAQLAELKTLLGAIGDSQSAAQHLHDEAEAENTLNWISPLYFGHRHSEVL